MKRYLTVFGIAAVCAFFVLGFPLAAGNARTGNPDTLAPAAPISITQFNVPITQDFNTLAREGGPFSMSLPGWEIYETGGSGNDDEMYTPSSGGNGTGDTFSFGRNAGDSDRALGGVRVDSLNPTFGATFVNNTGAPITQLEIAYTGEQWRLGSAGQVDQIIFQYSVNATSLANGIWTGVTDLNFSSPNTVGPGNKNGNMPQNRAARSGIISGLNIANGAAFYIRWTDMDVSSGEDGLAVDDFSLTAVAPLPNISVNDVTQAEGQGGTTNFTFTAGISAPAPAGGVTFDIATADGTAQDGNPLNEDQDYSSVSFAGMTIPQGQSSYQFTVAVNGDREVELNETFFVNLTNITGAVATDPQGVGTIQNDDDSPLALVVTKTDDTADGACDLDCSLREAIAAANSASGDDTITFAPSANGTTVLTADLPAISSNGTLTITGNGITNTIVSGPHSVFNVQTSALLAVSQIAISTAGGTGGPIVNEGTLTMDQCSIAGSTGGDGAVSNRPGGTLNILGCMISGNSVGGAIHTAGTTNITSSTINDNTSNARGAGIFMGNGALTIRESTISGNTATLEGGGIYKSDGNLLMVGITVSANSASAGGGLNSVNGTTTISNSTFAYNTSPIAGSGIREENSPVRISSSIVAANVNNLSVPDTEGAFDSGGFNLIGNRGEADGLVHGVGGDQVGPVATPTITSMGGATPLDPRLAPLGHYGGAVPSHAFDNSSGLSPAIDKGMAFGATLDTRGYARTYDFPAIDNNGGDGTDIGAFEIQAPSAAPVRLQGRVISGARRGVGGALVTMIGMDGARRSVRTSSFGYFRFEGIQAADSFILEVRAKRYRFAPRAVKTTDGLGEMIIVAEP